MQNLDLSTLYLSSTNSEKRCSIVVGIVDLFIEPLHGLREENVKCNVRFYLFFQAQFVYYHSSFIEVS